MNDSVAASAGPVPPIAHTSGDVQASPEPLVTMRMTPDPYWTMWRAAARAVM